MTKIASTRRTIARLERDWRAHQVAMQSIGQQLIVARRRLRELEGK